MNTTLAGLLLGAGAGALVSYKDKDLSDKAFAIGRGAAIGGSVGFWTRIIASSLKRNKIKKQIDAHTDATQTDLRKVVQRFRRAGVNVPVYLQTSGMPFENAAYFPSTSKYLAGMGTWKNVETGKKLDLDNLPESSIMIGSGFKKLPILAHELGHAQDLKGSIRPTALLAAGLLGTAAGFTGTVLQRQALKLHGDTTALKYWSGGLGLAGALLVAGAVELQSSMERNASRNAMDVLSKMQKGKAQERSADLLASTYGSYDPIQITEETFKPQAAATK